MNTKQLKTKKTVEEFMTEAGAKAVSEVAKTLLDFHSKHAVKELSDFAQQEIQRDRESRWISIDSAQPEALTWVMVWVQSRNMSFMVSYRAYPKDGSMWDDYQKHGLDPSEFKVWQPLPEAPKQLTP